ncbi:hypothetical protein CR105_07045 [Massilia eurypsychrophila]|jgi:hypothetical protein|uniref:MalT-like TPR region domain-containing protein n=1 Tax=Massilia eurypsychrophila TaxID=1485217 RepID=A0A2G8TID8_9BURK|nr:hypothetical protein [Massilia eurypsychrophila]PIL45811.1 hypothetical protein CR105_07045 [Massilia eurypsychrophila]
MTRHLHEPANALLYRALDLPSDQRQQFIADACEGDTELLALVKTLLARIEELDEFIESPLNVLAVSPAMQPAAPQLAEPAAPLQAETPPAAQFSAPAITPDAAQSAIDREPVEPAVAVPERGMWQRHPLGMSTAAVCACALVLVTSAALWHARQSDLARATAEQRVQTPGKPMRGAQFDGSAALDKIPVAARERFVNTAQAYQSQLAEVRRAGGDLDGALQAAQVSLGFTEQQARAHPEEVRWRVQLAAVHGQIGTILVEQGRTADGLAELRKALALRQEISTRDAGNEQLAREVADANAAIGNALMATMDNAAAEPAFAAARATYAAQLRNSPGDATLQAGLIDLELARANVQNLQRHGRDAVATLASLKALARDASKAGADPFLAVRVALLDAHIQPRGTPAQAYAAGQQALSELLKQTEKDPLDTARLRESAIAWQTTGEIGLRAGQTESACRYLGLAVKRYEELEKSKRLNAIDKLRLGQVQAQRKACG